MNNKVIFLDVDSVLNCRYTTSRTKSGWPFVDEEKIILLSKIILETKAAIILSSDWRYDKFDYPYEKYCESDLIELEECFKKHKLFIEDFTPIFYNRVSRDLEIKCFLSIHPEIKKWCVIDDGFCCAAFKENWFQTYWEDGLTEEIAEKIIDFFK